MGNEIDTLSSPTTSYENLVYLMVDIPYGSASQEIAAQHFGLASSGTPTLSNASNYSNNGSSARIYALLLG